MGSFNWPPIGVGAGTVTTVSVVSANGFAGTVSTATTTPAITLSTTINSPVLAGNGTALIAATTTGTGSTVALSVSPVFTTPNIGTATGSASLNVLTSALGNLTDAGTDGIVVTGGSGATVGNVSLAQHVADTTHNGYLSSSDWNTFTAKGNVTTVSVVSANGFTGTVATATTTPAITLATSITGILQGNGTAISAATTTGTGTTVALSVSPVFTTPNIGTATGSASLNVLTSALGNLTDAGTDGIVVTGGSGATVGNVSLAQHVADTTHNGYLSSADWNTFNGKGAGSVTSVTFTGDGTVLSSTPSSAVTASGTVTASLATAAARSYLAGPQSGSAAAPSYKSFTALTVQTFTAAPTGATNYTFTISSHAFIKGDTYTNNAQTFTVLSASATSTTLICSGTGTPAASGTLTWASGSGSGNITFSAFTGAYVAPTNPAPLYIKVTCVGGGGGGAGTVNTAGAGGGGGGGGGGTSIGYIASPALIYPLSLGAAGTSGGATGSGGTGGASTFNATFSGAGGVGGSPSVALNSTGGGGQGGLGSGGTINFAGNAGSNGALGVSGVFEGPGGVGGASYMGGGSPGGINGAPGNTGQVYGGGGGGGSAQAGGAAGAIGLIVVEEYYQ